MSNSSVPQVYSITSSDVITISDSSMANMHTASVGAGPITIGPLTQTQLDAITVTGSSGYTGSYIPPGSGLTSSGTISISTTGGLNGTSVSGAGANSYYTGSSNPFAVHIGEEWVDKFPDWHRVMEMCKEYPGLEIAFEKFKTTYKLVKDHYDTPEDQRPHI
jgi:hypothetical protein